MASKTGFFTTVCVLFFLVSPVVAEDGLIVIEGLSLPCSGCQVREDGYAEVVVGGEATMVKTDAALDLLLPKLLLEKTAPSHPRINELRRYLLRPGVAEKRARWGIELLFRSEKGLEAIATDADSFVYRYPQLIKEFFLQGRGDERVWSAYWKLPPTKDIAFDAELRAVLASISNKVGLKDLISGLGGVDTKRDQETLDIFKKVFSETKRDWGREIQHFKEIISLCERVSEHHRFLKGCTLADLKQLPGYQAAYLYRLQMKLVISELRQRDLAEIDRLNILQSANYRKYHTPDTHAALLDLVNQISVARYMKYRVSAASHKNLEMLTFFAKNDKKIGRAVTKLLIQTSLDAFKGGQPGFGLSLLEDSFAVYPEHSERRWALLDLLRNEAQVQQSTKYREWYQKLVRRDAEENVGLSESKAESGSIWLVIAVVLGGGIFLGVIAVYLIRRVTREPVRFGSGVYQKPGRWSRRQKSAGAGLGIGSRAAAAYAAEEESKREAEFAWKKKLSRKERAELRQVLSYFNLPATASAEDVNKVYKARAKEAHPDTAHGDHDEFVRLTENFERAKQLMSSN